MQQQAPSTAKKVVFWTIGLLIIIPGGLGFVDKFVQFIRTLRMDQGGGFTLVPIVNYLLVAAGFICLLIWAVARGMFRDVERPKYDMLETEEQLERNDGRDWSSD